MNNEKRFIGTFQTETELITKVQELKATGISDNNIYVIAKDDKDLHMLRSRTDAEVKTTDGSWMDKFMNFLSGENHIDNLLSDTGLSEAEKDRYTREINDGAMLLYVDEGEVDTLHRENSDRYSMGEASNDANLRTDEFTEPPGSTGILGTGKDQGSLHGNYDHTAASVENRVETDRLQGDGNVNRTIEEVPEKMKVHEERLNVNKQQVQKGEVTVDKNVVEERKTTDIPVEHEEVTIERRPVSGEMGDNTQTADAFDDETIRVPVTEEKVEVTKKPVVTEEIVINKKRVTDTEHVDENLKREEVEVDRKGDTKDVNLKGGHDSMNPNRTDKF